MLSVLLAAGSSEIIWLATVTPLGSLIGSTRYRSPVNCSTKSLSLLVSVPTSVPETSVAWAVNSTGCPRTDTWNVSVPVSRRCSRATVPGNLAAGSWSNAAKGDEVRCGDVRPAGSWCRRTQRRRSRRSRPEGRLSARATFGANAISATSAYGADGTRRCRAGRACGRHPRCFGSASASPAARLRGPCRRSRS